MKAITFLFLITIGFGTMAQVEVSNSENARVEAYLPATNGLIVGVKIKNSAGETKNLRFGSTRAQSLMDNFPVGSQARFTFSTTTYGDIQSKLYGQLFKRPNPIPQLPNTAMYLRWTSMALKEEWPTLKRKSIRNRRKVTAYVLVSVVKGDKGIIIPEKEEYLGSFEPRKEIIEGIKVVKVDRRNRYSSRITLANGRTFVIRKYYKEKALKATALMLSFPLLFQGEVHTDSDYSNNPTKVIPLRSYSVDFAKPVYDGWARLFGYRAKINNQDSFLSFPTHKARSLVENIDPSAPTKIFSAGPILRTFQSNGNLVFRENNYSIEAVSSARGNITISSEPIEDYEYLPEITFSSVVSEIQNINELNSWELHYNNYIALENGYVFNLSKKVLSSFSEPLTTGVKITITGQPFSKREGEVLKDDNFKLIRPKSLTIGNVTYNIRIR